MLYAPRATVESILGIQPRYYIIMENLLQGLGNSSASDEEAKWETNDLKPEDYSFPERDVADGMLRRMK
ncbi:t1pks [Epichloe bromicola]